MERFGVGPGIIGRMEILPFARLFRIAGRYHDVAYERGGDEERRKKADRMFLSLMLVVCSKPIHYYFAYRYYEAVKKYGMFYFRYNISNIVAQKESIF